MAKGAISSLLVRIGADTSDLEKGGRRASKSMDDLGKKAGDLGLKMAKLGAAAAAAGAAIAIGLVKNGLSAISAQADLAQSLDGSINSLRTLQLAAQNAGVAADAMSGNVLRMNRRLGEMATTGAGPAAAWIDRLGLSARDLLSLPLDDRVSRISEEISKLSTSAEMASAAFAIFGDGGLKMVPMLQGGSDAIRAARQEVEDFGLSLSQVDASKVKAAGDAIQRMSHVFEAIRNKITVAVAPILEELADRFNKIAKENKGFGDQVVSTMESVSRSFAFVLDRVHEFHVAIKGLQLVAEGFAAAFFSALELVMNAITSVTDAVAKAINFAIRAVNQFGGTLAEIPMMSESAWAQDFRRFADGSRDRVGRVRQELHDLAMQEYPSDKVEAFFSAVQKRAQEAAEATAAAMSGSSLEGGQEFDEEAALKAFEEEAEFLRKRYEMRSALEGELKSVNDAFMQELERKHVDELNNITIRGLTEREKFIGDSFKNQVKTVSGHLADITAGVARENRAMFEANKVAGIANAIVSAYEGISKTLGAYPFPISAVMAAAQATAAFAQVSAIKSASFSGGGAAPSLAGGTPATPVTPVMGGTPSTPERSVLTVEGIDAGSLFSGRAVRELAERLQEHIRDGGSVQFA